MSNRPVNGKKIAAYIGMPLLFWLIIMLVLVGLLLNPWLPINKPLWSSSYVCFAGGLSMLLMALFYQLIDVWGYKRWSFYFRVIGLNAINATEIHLLDIPEISPRVNFLIFSFRAHRDI